MHTKIVLYSIHMRVQVHSSPLQIICKILRVAEHVKKLDGCIQIIIKNKLLYCLRSLYREQRESG